MISFCSKCNINWSRLETIDGEGDEQYEVCPLCGSDMYLQDGNDFVSYIRCAITGKILNAETKEELVMELPPLPPTFQRISTPRETNEQREERELRAIEAYIATGSQQDYFNTIKKS